MSVSENDLENLEAWLDGELSDDQVDALRRRFSSEPDLSQAMDRLRADRQFRSQLFQTLEPSEAEVDTLVAAVRSSVRKEDVWTSRYRVLRNISAIAASIVFVFMAGWLTNSRVHIGLQEAINPTVNSKPMPAIFGPSIDNDKLKFQSEPVTLHLIGVPVDSRMLNNGDYKVQIVDPNGQVVSSQSLNRIEAPTIRMHSEQAPFQLQPQRSSDPVFVSEEQPLNNK